MELPQVGLRCSGLKLRQWFELKLVVELTVCMWLCRVCMADADRHAYVRLGKQQHSCMQLLYVSHVALGLNAICHLQLHLAY